MAIARCPNGHYYDDAKFSSCPHCSVFGANPRPDATQSAAFRVPSFGDEEKTVSKERPFVLDDEKTERFAGGDEEKTIGFMRSALRADPVVGWLVCVEGAEKGRDYRLHAGRNFIGRTWKMDVNIVDDRSISRENHASIVFEPNEAVFMIVNGESVKTYLNGVPVTSPMPLAAGDKVGLGDSLYDFVPYCGRDRRWI
jgi:hypothetical protein